MVALPQSINANDIPERDDFSPIPPGSYTAMVTASETKATKDGTGEMLVLDISVVDGEFTGRKVFERINWKNKNPQAVEIAYKTLGEIIRATGKQQLDRDTSELHNKRLMIDVEIEPGKPYQKDGVTVEGKPQNRIKKYHAIGSTGQATAAAQPASGGAVTGARPWAK